MAPFNLLNLLGLAGGNRNMLQNVSANAGGVPPLDPAVNVGPSPVVASPNMLSAVAGPAPQAVPMQEVAAGGGRPSDFSFLTPDRKQFLQDMFIGWAAGATPQQSLSLGAAQAAKGSGQRKDQNATLDWLKGRGVSESDARMLANSPGALNEYVQSIYQKPSQKPPIEINGRLVDPTTYEVIADFSDPNKGTTDDQREYNLAREQGFNGNFLDYQIKMKEAGRNQVNIDTGSKLPANFMWIDPADQRKGVKPIPNGPGEQIPGELAARVGMADNFIQNDLPQVRDRIKAGEVTGPIDRFRAANQSSSPQAEVYRKIQSGVEVMSRLLSGAGMTQVEIDEKAQRYMPTYTDDAASMASKLDQLENELQAAKNMALRGRGPTDTAAPAQGQPQVRRYNPATGAIE